MPLNFDELKDPTFDVVIGGKTISFDPYVVVSAASKISREQIKLSDDHRVTDEDAIRLAFSLPTQAAVDAAPADAKPWTPTPWQCRMMMVGITEFLNGLEVTKKELALWSNSPSAQGSTPNISAPSQAISGTPSVAPAK